MGLKTGNGAEIQAKLIFYFPEFSDLMTCTLKLDGFSWQPKILGASTPNATPNVCSDGYTCKAGVLTQLLSNSCKGKRGFHLSTFIVQIKSSINPHLEHNLVIFL